VREKKLRLCEKKEVRQLERRVPGLFLLSQADCLKLERGQALGFCKEGKRPGAFSESPLRKKGGTVGEGCQGFII